MKDNAKFFHTIEQLHNLHEIYGEKKQEKVEIPSKKGIIFDVGAHIGIFSIKEAIKNQDSVIFAIEPEEKNFALLRRNIKLNKLRNVRPFRVAFLDKNSFMKLKLHPFESGQHSFFSKENRYEIVKTFTLNSFCKKYKISNITLLKIDTEGVEYRIILGALHVLKDFKPSLIIETHPQYDPNCEKK